MLLVSYIQQYFDTSITVLTNQVWKLLIALFKVPNTGAFMVIQISEVQFIIAILNLPSCGNAPTNISLPWFGWPVIQNVVYFNHYIIIQGVCQLQSTAYFAVCTVHAYTPWMAELTRHCTGGRGSLANAQCKNLLLVFWSLFKWLVVNCKDPRNLLRSMFLLFFSQFLGQFPLVK